MPKYKRIKVGVNQWKYLHRYIMELKIGRPLRSDEWVHHIDGDGLNNSIENLAIFKPHDHLSMHNNRKGKHHTPEAKTKISIAMHGKKGSFLGKHHTPETRARISATMTGKKHPHKPPRTSTGKTQNKLSEGDRAPAPAPAQPQLRIN